MRHYTKFVAIIKGETIGGVKLHSECPSPIALLDEAVSMAFREHGEQHVRNMFDAAITRELRYKVLAETEAAKERKNV